MSPMTTDVILCYVADVLPLRIDHCREVSTEACLYDKLPLGVLKVVCRMDATFTKEEKLVEVVQSFLEDVKSEVVINVPKWS